MRKNIIKMAIYGAGKGGSLLIPVIHNSNVREVVVVVDKDKNAPGLKIAREHNIETVVSDNCESILENDIDVVINTTGIENINDDILTAIRQKEWGNRKIPQLMTGLVAQLAWEVIAQKQFLDDLFEFDTIMLAHDKPCDAAGFIVEKALELTCTKKGSLLCFDEASFELRALYSRGYDNMFKSDWETMDKGVIRKVIREKQIVIVNNIQEDKGYITSVTQMENIQSFIIVPIIATYKLVGILALNDTKPRAFSEAEIKSIKLLTTHSSYILNKDMLTAQLRKKNDYLEAINKISDVTSRSLNIKEIAEKGLRKVLEILDYKIGLVRVFNGDSLELIASVNISADYLVKHKIININDMIRNVKKLKEGKIICVDDAEKEAEERKISSDYLKQDGVKSFVLVPLMSADKIVGIINLGNDYVTNFRAEPIDILTSIGNVMGTAIENAKFHENLEQKLNRVQTVEGLWESTGDLIIITDMDRKIIEFNESAEYLLEYKKHEVIGHGICLFFRRKDDECKLTKLLKENNNVYNYYTQFIKSNSEIIDVSISQSYMQDSARNSIGIVNIIRNISEADKINRQMIQSDKLASIGVLASGVAHELKNPLGAVLLQIQLLQKSLIGTIEYERIKDILENISKMREIIDHIGEFSRESEIKLVPNNINEIIKSSFTMLNQQLHDNNIEVVIESDPNIPKILCDRLKLEQVFLNLILNAKDAISANVEGREKRITIIIKNEDNKITVSVSDTGIGISDKEKNRIFDPFFSMKKIGMGTGLGLSISYGIIREHEGSIEFESKLGKGTTFTIQLAKQ